MVLKRARMSPDAEFGDRLRLDDADSDGEGRLPEIDMAPSDTSDDVLSDDAALLQELREEAALEDELRASQDSANESDFEGTPHRDKDQDLPAALAAPGSNMASEEKTRILGFDSRDYLRRGQRVKSAITGQPKMVWPEIEPGYGSESGDDEPANRVGRIPAHFYDDLPHLGYDVDGKRVMRPAIGDALDKFLSTVDKDGAGWTSAPDKSTGLDVQLTEDELELVQRLARSENPDGDYDRALHGRGRADCAAYEPALETFTAPGMELKTPLHGRSEPKRRFVPSRWEHKKARRNALRR